MFVWECIKSEGSHVGVCVDTFMFGSCCVHNSTTNNVNAPPGPGVTSGTRPSLAEALSVAPTRPSLGSTQSRPASSPRPHGYASTSNASVPRPQRPNSQRPRPTSGEMGPGRPAQKRPHSKPNANQDNRLDPATQGSRPLSVRNPTLDNGLPTVSGSLVVSHQADDSKTKTKTQIQEKPMGPTDKVDNSHNTLLVKLPSRIPGQNLRPHRPGYQNQKPSTADRPSESRPDDSKQEEPDLVVQATMHRPSVDSVDKNVSFFPLLGSQEI